MIQKDIKVLLFRSGTEFLVCKREQVGETVHVHLREVNLGLGKNVVLWCDDSIRKSTFQKVLTWIREKQYSDQYNTLGTQYVFRTQSIITKAYCESLFFKLSIKMSENFRFIQNLNRASEN